MPRQSEAARTARAYMDAATIMIDLIGDEPIERQQHAGFLLNFVIPSDASFAEVIKYLYGTTKDV